MNRLNSIKLQCDINSLRISLLGKMCYSIRRHFESIAIKNINTIFENTLTAREKKHLAIAYYSHLITSIKECLLLRCLNRKRLESNVEFRGLNYFLEAAKKNKGIILLTGHLGSWEFAPVVGLPTLQTFPGRFHVIRKPLRFEFLNHIFYKPWMNTKMNVIDHQNALIRTIKALKAHDAVLFVFDQRAREPNSFLIDFLEKSAPTYNSLAHIVQHLNSPVLPLAGYRISSQKHIIEFYPPIPWIDHADKDEALRINTKQYSEALENIILKNPAQWIWSYKRWKFNE